MEMPILEVINDVQEIFSNFILQSTIKKCLQQSATYI